MAPGPHRLFGAGLHDDQAAASIVTHVDHVLRVHVRKPRRAAGRGALEISDLYSRAVLLSHLNGVTVLRFCSSGARSLLGCLIVIALYRRSTNSNVDRAGRVPTPDVLIKLALVSMAGTLFIYLSGLVTQGSNPYAIWQVNLVIYLPILFLLFQSALRGPKDAATLARVLIAAGITRPASDFT